jgi:hypothetical protein
MAANVTITSDQSIALPEVVVTAPAPSGGIGGGSHPSDVIKPLSGGGANVLRYPSDLPKYFMKFDVHEYSRAGLQTVGTLGNVLNTIALALPSDLTDTNQVD